MPKAKPKIDLTCAECGAPFQVQPYRERTAKTCSTLCRQRHISKSTRGIRAAILRRTGSGTGYVKLHGRHMHRVAAEKKLGRKLTRGEVVHHIDGNKFNNEASNLLVTTQSEHCKLHGFGGRKNCS